jgi:hypothetical protein
VRIWSPGGRCCGRPRCRRRRRGSGGSTRGSPASSWRACSQKERVRTATGVTCTARGGGVRGRAGARGSGPAGGLRRPAADLAVGLGSDALSGGYRQVFETALAASGPVTMGGSALVVAVQPPGPREPARMGRRAARRLPRQVLFRTASRRTGLDGFPIIRLSSDYCVDDPVARAAWMRSWQEVAGHCGLATPVQHEARPVGRRPSGVGEVGESPDAMHLDITSAPADLAGVREEPGNQ